MADLTHLAILEQGNRVWNKWRQENSRSGLISAVRTSAMPTSPVPTLATLSSVEPTSPMCGGITPRYGLVGLPRHGLADLETRWSLGQRSNPLGRKLPYF